MTGHHHTPTPSVYARTSDPDMRSAGEELTGMGDGGIGLVAGEHPGHLGDSGVAGHRCHVGKRCPAVDALGDDHLLGGCSRDLGEVRDHEHLVMFGQVGQGPADRRRGDAAHAGVTLGPHRQVRVEMATALAALFRGADLATTLADTATRVDALLQQYATLNQ